VKTNSYQVQISVKLQTVSTRVRLLKAEKVQVGMVSDTPVLWCQGKVANCWILYVVLWHVLLLCGWYRFTALTTLTEQH